MVIRHSPIVVEIFSTCFTMPWLLYHMQCAIILASAIYFSLSIHMIHFPNLQSTLCSRLLVARSHALVLKKLLSSVEHLISTSDLQNS
jgi:hypothetical protein